MRRFGMSRILSVSLGVVVQLCFARLRRSILCQPITFASEQQEFDEAVEGIREGYEEVLAGLSEPADVVFERLRVKHGFPS
ncbi:MAG TPA: hypothetical protein VGG97_11240 [Bryobacteraceae bacterium]|jgi:hypothetical protein